MQKFGNFCLENAIHGTIDVEISLAKGIVFTKIGPANGAILKLWAAHPYLKFSQEPPRDFFRRSFACFALFSLFFILFPLENVQELERPKKRLFLKCCWGFLDDMELSKRAWKTLSTQSPVNFRTSVQVQIPCLVWKETFKTLACV